MSPERKHRAGGGLDESLQVTTGSCASTPTPTVFYFERTVPGGGACRAGRAAPSGAPSPELPGLSGLSPGTTRMTSPCRKLWPRGRRVGDSTGHSFLSQPGFHVAGSGLGAPAAQTELGSETGSQCVDAG